MPVRQAAYYCNKVMRCAHTHTRRVPPHKAQLLLCLVCPRLSREWECMDENTVGWMKQERDVCS